MKNLQNMKGLSNMKKIYNKFPFYKKIVPILLSAFLLQSSCNHCMNSISNIKNNFNNCKISPSSTNNFEPEYFPTSNNLLRSQGELENIHGKKIIIKGKLFDKNCIPVSDAVINIWQVGSDGKYHFKPLRNIIKSNYIFNDSSKSSFIGAGTAVTNNLGEFVFITEYPAKLWRDEPNVNLRISHRLTKNFDTKIYLKNTCSSFDKPKILKDYIDNNYDDMIYEVKVTLPYNLEIRRF